jgi:hypothetical protein
MIGTEVIKEEERRLLEFLRHLITKTSFACPEHQPEGEAEVSTAETNVR